MDRKLILKLFAGTSFVLAIIFLPIIMLEGQVINLVDCMQINGFNWVSTPFLAIIVTYFVLIFSFLFSEKLPTFYPTFFAGIINVVLMFMIPYFYAMKCGVGPYDLDIIFYYPFPFIVLTSILCLIYSISKIFNDLRFTVRDIAEIGIYISLSLVLDLSIFKFRVGPNGGSISAAMLPLIILVLRKGFSKGFIACGLIYGFIDCLMDGYGLFTFPFDYLFGFGALAIIGLFKDLIFNNKGFMKYLFLVISMLAAGVVRLFAATLSGMIFYDTSFWESILYQLTYIPLSLAICMVITCLGFPFIEKINKRYT